MSLTSTDGDLILRIASAMANCGAVLTFCLSTRSFLTAQHVDTEHSMVSTFSTIALLFHGMLRFVHALVKSVWEAVEWYDPRRICASTLTTISTCGTGFNHYCMSLPCTSARQICSGLKIKTTGVISMENV